MTTTAAHTSGAVQAPANPRVLAPFTIVIDRRERDPWAFRSVRGGADQGHARLDVPTVRGDLPAAGYGVAGREAEIVVARKTAGELFSALTFNRREFEGDLERLRAAVAFSMLLIESEFAALVERPPIRMSARAFVGSVVALMERFPTKWIFAGSRQYAEAVAYRVLERWVRDREKEAKPKRAKARAGSSRGDE